MADRLGIDSIDREARVVVLKFRPQANVDPVRLVSLMRQRPDLTLVPPAALRLSLDRAEGTGQNARADPAVSPTPSALSAKPSALSPKPSALSPKKGGSHGSAAPSWWTSRARTGEVKPGFTKEDILRPAKEDPRAAGGVFERVGGLLSDLLDQG